MSTNTVDALRKRRGEVQQADDARNSLLDDLLQKVDDMQKTMDRNAFVMVLIDGDGMTFLNEFVKQGMLGGDEAAKLLRRAVFEYLRHDEDFKHDHKIVIRVYANIRGLSKTYADKGILPTQSAFLDFILGFNKAHPLCDFIDAGNHKEAADTKLKETLSLYVYNVHCKQIIFGASADNAYASFLSSFFVDTDVSSLIRLLKGPPFSFGFKNMLSKFKYTEFKDVFNSQFISSEPAQHSAWRRSQQIGQSRSQEPLPTTTFTSAMPWRPKRATDSHATHAAVDKGASPAVNGTGDLLDPADSDVDSEEDGVVMTGRLPHKSSPALSTSSSAQASRRQSRSNPTEDDLVAALISSTNQRLKTNPRDVNFGIIKEGVEQKLGLSGEFWGRSERDEWFSKSKNIIKRTVEEWVERTGNAPPKNATWMPSFSSAKESPVPVKKIPAPAVARVAVEEIPSAPRSVFDQAIDREVPDSIFVNARGQRVDIPTTLHVSQGLMDKLRDRDPRLCNVHHLVRGCTWKKCPYDHDSTLTDHEFEALMYLSRSQRCLQDSACMDAKCTKGHMCLNGGSCTRGNNCRFANLHGMDTMVANKITFG